MGNLKMNRTTERLRAQWSTNRTNLAPLLAKLSYRNPRPDLFAGFIRGLRSLTLHILGKPSQAAFLVILAMGIAPAAVVFARVDDELGGDAEAV